MFPPRLAIVLCTLVLLTGTARWCPAADDDQRATLAKLNAAIDQYPKRADAYLYRGLIWQQMGERTRAMQDFDTAIILNPKVADGYAHRAIVWQELGKLENAVTDFSTAIKLDPGDASNFVLRGTARHSLGEIDLAIKDWSEAIRLDPKQAETYMQRALAWGMKDEFEKALKDCAAALRINPRLRPVWQLQGWIKATCPDARFRDGPRAVQSAEKACTLAEWKDAFAVETLAAAYAETGDFASALRWQKKAITLMGPADAALPDARLRLSLYESRKPFRDDSR